MSAFTVVNVFGVHAAERSRPLQRTSSTLSQSALTKFVKAGFSAIAVMIRERPTAGYRGVFCSEHCGEKRVEADETSPVTTNQRPTVK